MMYGVVTLCDISSRRSSFAAMSVVFSICSFRLSILERMIAPRMIGLKKPASLLQTPMMLMRCAAPSIGPMMVTYGLDAVCNIDRPRPCVNRPIRKYV